MTDESDQGFACGPLVWGPLSEKVGRKYPLVIGLGLFALFSVPIALAKSLSTILVCRFFSGAFGSSSMAVTGGALTDLWSSPVSRGIAMDCFVSMGFIGPVLGPIAGTFLVHSSLGWRWAMWIMAIVSASLSLVALVFLPETYAPILIPRQSYEKKVEPRKATIEHGLVYVKTESVQFLRDYLSRPLGECSSLSPYGKAHRKSFGLISFNQLMAITFQGFLPPSLSSFSSRYI